jgi:hypothetical protein
MTSLTQPLRAEHRDLLPHVEQFRHAANAIGETPADTNQQDVGAALRFLTGHLIPHASAEEAAL